MQFKEWMNNGPEVELENWFKQFSSAIIHSIQPSEGYISIKINSLIKQPQVQTNNPVPSNANLEPVREDKGVGWKGKAAIDNLSPQINWNQSQKNTFKNAMNAGTKSLPALIGKEMGLLFEVDIFLYLVNKFKLKPIGEKNVDFVSNERARLINEINLKVKNLTDMVVEFMGVHAQEMGELIYQKTVSLVTECKVNSIEFTGGALNGKNLLKSDTADLRIGCSKYLEGMRNNIGYSLKATTEPEMEIRHFSPMKAISILGAGPKTKKHIKDIFDVPETVMHYTEKREELIKILEKLAIKNFTNRPVRFTRLLELLVTGGADTLPAYKNIVRNSGEPGWAGAMQKNFNTNEEPPRMLNPRTGGTVEVFSNKTYIVMKYMAPGGNHYGTTIKLRVDPYGKIISFTVTGLAAQN